MALGEFDLIDQFFKFPNDSDWKSQGIGDDCALIELDDRVLAVTADMMAITTHFLPDADPETVGYKALAVNLSDLAAAGAKPQAFFLSISMPEIDEAWLAGFSKGLKTLAQQSRCSLLGGDTTRSALVGATRSPTTIAITAMGELPKGQGLTRRGAQVGDDIWVSGTLGDAYTGLKHRWGHWQVPGEDAPYFYARMDRPTPRYLLGQHIRPYASAAADVSDGFMADLGHILERSAKGARIELNQMPCSAALARLPAKYQQEAMLYGGDDYELIFTSASIHREKLLEIAKALGEKITCVGRIQSAHVGDYAPEVWQGATRLSLGKQGFDHFKESSC